MLCDSITTICLLFASKNSYQEISSRTLAREEFIHPESVNGRGIRLECCAISLEQCVYSEEAVRGASRADRINSSRGIGRGWERENALRPEGSRQSGSFLPRSHRRPYLPGIRASASKRISQQALSYARCKCVHAVCTGFPGVTAPR